MPVAPSPASPGLVTAKNRQGHKRAENVSFASVAHLSRGPRWRICHKSWRVVRTYVGSDTSYLALRRFMRHRFLCWCRIPPKVRKGTLTPVYPRSKARVCQELLKTLSFRGRLLGLSARIDASFLPGATNAQKHSARALKCPSAVFLYVHLLTWQEGAYKAWIIPRAISPYKCFSH